MDVPHPDDAGGDRADVVDVRVGQHPAADQALP
jgi:hypothetical protein